MNRKLVVYTKGLAIDTTNLSFTFVFDLFLSLFCFQFSFSFTGFPFGNHVHQLFFALMDSFVNAIQLLLLRCLFVLFYSLDKRTGFFRFVVVELFTRKSLVLFASLQVLLILAINLPSVFFNTIFDLWLRRILQVVIRKPFKLDFGSKFVNHIEVVRSLNLTRVLAKTSILALIAVEFLRLELVNQRSRIGSYLVWVGLVLRTLFIARHCRMFVSSLCGTVDLNAACAFTLVEFVVGLR